MGFYGKVQTLDVICILTMNPMLAQVYMMIWFWFTFLIVAFVFVILYRLTILYRYKSRGWFIRHDSNDSTIPMKLNKICSININVFFLIDTLKKAMDSVSFEQMIRGIATKLDSIDIV